MHTVFALLCFVVVIHWLIFPYPSGLLHWHCGNLTIVPVPAKQPWWIWINTSCEFIMNDCIITTKQSTTKPCAYFLGYTVSVSMSSFSLLMLLGSWWPGISRHKTDVNTYAYSEYEVETKWWLLGYAPALATSLTSQVLNHVKYRDSIVISHFPCFYHSWDLHINIFSSEYVAVVLW